MENKENIYITNFWWAVNYGANLTAYALYQVVSGLNKNTFLLDNLHQRERLFFNKYYVKNFVNKYFKIKKYENDSNAVLITGSDQVFNPNCEVNHNNSKFLNFGNLTNKKIAMSASFGIDKETFLRQNSKEVIENIKQLLKSFDLISVREKTGIEICNDLFDVPAEWIIDPVFILEKEKWDELVKNASRNIRKQIKKAKIVSYILDKTKEHDKAYEYLSKKYKTKIIELGDYKNSPENWLYAIRNCELFVTNSFHGVCFAIIFNKPFICLSKETGKSTRFESLFDMLQIENQSININQIYDKDCIFKVDYKRVNERIKSERQRGIEFIQKALEAPITKTQEKIDVRIQYLEQRVFELERQNNLPYQLKKYLWEKWLEIFHCYIPKPIKKVISLFWHTIKRFIKK